MKQQEQLKILHSDYIAVSIILTLGSTCTQGKIISSFAKKKPQKTQGFFNK